MKQIAQSNQLRWQKMRKAIALSVVAMRRVQHTQDQTDSGKAFEFLYFVHVTTFSVYSTKPRDPQRIKQKNMIMKKKMLLSVNDHGFVTSDESGDLHGSVVSDNEVALI